MDTLTHGIAGSVFTRTLAGRPRARPALLLGLSAAMAPDLDFLFLSDRLDYLRNHRGWTHSFVVLPLLALGLALIARISFRRLPLSTLWFFCAVGIGTHILLDWITSFGTMFWIPFSRTRYSLDWVFILDPIVTLIASGFLLAAALLRSRGRLLAALGAGLLCAYLAFCAMLHRRALELWRRMDQPPAGARVAVLPQFLSPFRWFGLTEHAEEIHVAFFDIGPFARGVEHPRAPTRLSELFASLSDFYPPPERARIRRFVKPPESPVLSAARRLPEVQTYLAFARFPLATIEPQPGGGAIILWQDLRFLPWFAGPWGSGGNGGFRRQPFIYRVRLDANGRPLEQALVSSFHVP